MAHELANQRGSFGDRDFGVSDLGGNHRLQHRCFALDNEVAQAMQFAELIDAALHQDSVAAAQHGLPARQGVATAVPDQRQYDQARRGADTTVGQRLADQDGIARYPQQESSFVQLVAGAQAALAHVLIALAPLLGQQQAAEQGHEQHAADHDGTAHRREIEQFERFITAQCKRLADEQVRGRADQCHQAAKQGRIRERHEQPGCRDSCSACNVDDDGQHQRSDADVVHESG